MRLESFWNMIVSIKVTPKMMKNSAVHHSHIFCVGAIKVGLVWFLFQRCLVIFYVKMTIYFVCFIFQTGLNVWTRILTTPTSDKWDESNHTCNCPIFHVLLQKSGIALSHSAESFRCALGKAVSMIVRKFQNFYIWQNIHVFNMLSTAYTGTFRLQNIQKTSK